MCFVLFKQSLNGNGKELNRLLNSRITEALNRWDADKIGMPDYALESSGIEHTLYLTSYIR